MAVSKSIREDLNNLFDMRCQAETLVQSLELVGDQDNLHPLVYVMRCHIERWAAACDSLERTLRSKAIPLVEDMERATK